jgi:DNA mismatch repair protein MutS2
MIEYSIRVLEYYRLLDILSKYAASPLGRLDCLSLKPLHNLEHVEAEQRLVSEMKELLLVKGFVPLSSLDNIRPAMQKASIEGTCLEVKEFLSIYNLISVSHKVKKWLLQHRDLCPYMAEIAGNIPTCHDVLQEIGKSITEDGSISDSASPALFSLRSKRATLRADIDKRLHDILKAPEFSDDSLISMRDGRYIISVRTKEKSHVNGIIHGYSMSRSTCFLEPLSAIGENNHLVELTEREKEEERKVLKKLTGLVSHFSHDLLACLNIMSKIDGIFARAEFSKAIGGIRPVLTSDKRFFLTGAYNPILLSLNLEPPSDDRKGRREGVVPIDVDIRSDKNTLIISGPNRGGKTVALKTMGLLALMSQAGIHIPASEGSVLGVFSNILADIGDEQDISSGLSTFSARLEHLKKITNQATENSLVILDELGSGTDPDEGTAIAMAVLDYLSEKGSLTAISTHYQILKEYGFINKKAQNASVEFDIEHNKPTFRLTRGAPGVSHAIDTAIDLGIKKEIIDGAVNYLGEDKGRLQSMMEDLSRIMKDLESEKEVLEIKRQEYDGLKRDLEEKEGRLKGQIDELLIHKEQEMVKIVSEAKTEFGEAIALIKEKGASGQLAATKKYTETKKKIVETLQGLRREEPSVECSEVHVGQDVFYGKLKKIGRVIGIDERSSKAQILMGNVKLAVDLSELSPIKDDNESGRNKGKERPWSLYSPPEAKKELNIVGHTVDEAIPLVDTLIDKALVHGYSSVKIIHGMGLGVLKRAVREHLKENHFVKSLIPGDTDGGSDGYTVVQL